MTNELSEKSKANSFFTLRIPERAYEVKGGSNSKVMLNNFRITVNKDGSPPPNVSMILNLQENTSSLNSESTTITAGCNSIPSSFENLPILRTTKELTFQEAITLKGKAIDKMFAIKKPFLVTIPDLPYRSISTEERSLYQHTPCYEDFMSACLMLITKPESEERYKSNCVAKSNINSSTNNKSQA
jgi:hypothetical protein